MQRSTLEIAATWLACGLDPDKVCFYRQSDIPEIPELTWLLTCVAGKGMLNRAHAYKAAVDKNRAERRGRRCRRHRGPVHVPGADGRRHPDVQRATRCRWAATRSSTSRWRATSRQRFNHLYGEHFALPEAVIDEHVATLPGLDGRKMSKSYDNTIPLFAPREQLKKLISSHRHRLARAGRAQGRRRLGRVPALPGLRLAGGNRGDAPGLRRRHRLGRRQAGAVRAHRPRDRAAARDATTTLIAQPGRDRERCCATARKRLRERYAHADAGARCAKRSACATCRAQPPAARKKAAKTRAADLQAVPRSDGRFYFKLVDGDRAAAAEHRLRVGAHRRPADRPPEAGRRRRAAPRRGRGGAPGRRADRSPARRRRTGRSGRSAGATGRRGRMNPFVELNLALILFLPWFAILGVLYWMFPRQPRHAVAQAVRRRRAAAGADGVPAEHVLVACERRPGLRQDVAADPRDRAGLRRVPGGADGGLLRAAALAAAPSLSTARTGPNHAHGVFA